MHGVDRHHRFKLFLEMLCEAYLSCDDPMYQTAAVELTRMLESREKAPAQYVHGTPTMMHTMSARIGRAISQLGGKAKLDRKTDNIKVTVGNKYFYVTSLYAAQNVRSTPKQVRHIVLLIRGGANEVMLDGWETPMKVHML